MELKLAPDPILREKSVKITKFDKDLVKFAYKLDEVRRQFIGLGISAIQTGHPIQLIIIGDGKVKYFLCNPEIVYKSSETHILSTGCLSYPGIFKDQEFPVRIKINYLDLKGRKQELTCYNVLAQCGIHECQHLEGRLLEDE